MRSIICLLLALALTVSAPALAEGEKPMHTEAPSTHFVPENPDIMPIDDIDHPIDLSARRSVYGQPTGEDTGDGEVSLSGGVTSKVMFPMPFTLEKGQSVTVTVKGRFAGKEDAGIRVYLTNLSADNCTQEEPHALPNKGMATFRQTFLLTASDDADAIMVASSSYDTFLQQFTLVALSVNGGAHIKKEPTSFTYEESAASDWYPALLEASHMRLGNNLRLKKLIERAQAGEKLTVATIGGSITEGAGAATYRECYAYQLYEGFRQKYGVDGGENIAFVNAGVGGTPSTFGYMRYDSEVVQRVKDDDGLPDLVVIEFAVNDGGEPTNHRCYESMVRDILSQPNQPVVILLFAVFDSGYNLQREIRKIGDAYDLMMVSILDGAFPYVGDKWTREAFFFDQYHPTSLGHRVMADCVLSTVEAAAAQPTSEQDINLDVKPAYGADFVGLRTILRKGGNAQAAVDMGSFAADDAGSYRNLPVGRVCGENFHHTGKDGNAPMTFTASFRNLMVAYRTLTDERYGNAEVYVDGERVAVLKANTGSWGQSVVDLVYDEETAREHTVEIRMAPGSEEKLFTITCMGYTPEP